MSEPPGAAGLERRLALLEDERAVLRTLHRYAHALDYGDEAAWIDLFTDDAVFDARGRNPSDVTRVTRGREALAEFAARFSWPPAGWHKHLVIEPLVDVSGDEATATSYLAVLRDEGDVPVLWVFGRYRDRLVRCADGRWRFTERIAEVESVDARYPSLAFRRP
jgi:ketosteroid isomerase-like protein